MSWGSGTHADPWLGTSPAMEKIRRGQMRADLKRRYAEVNAQLGLTEDQSRGLLDVLVRQSEGFSFNLMASGGEAEMRRVVQERRQREADEISALLGPDKAQQLAAFQASLPARAELEALASVFEGADAPLSGAQREHLLARLIEEQARIPAPDHEPVSRSENYHALYKAWRTEYEARVEAAARSILTTEQLAAHQEYRQWQRDMHNSISFTAVGVAGATGSGEPITFVAPTFVDAQIVENAPENPQRR